MAKSPEITELALPLASGGLYKTELYKGVTKNGFRSDFEDVIVLAHGWLGNSTMHFAATELARAGHDVAVVNHGKRSVWKHNKQRSQNVHFTARSAVQETGKPGVILLGHSNGSQDVHHAARDAVDFQRKKRRSEYTVRAVVRSQAPGLPVD